MKNLINDFLDHIEAEGKSANTIDAYRRDLSLFLDRCDTTGADAVTPKHIDAFLLTLRHEGKAVSTVNRTISAVKSLFAWAVEQGAVSENPARFIRIRRTKAAPRTVLSLEEKSRLLKTLRTTVDPFALRDRTMIHLMLATGIRVSELVNLDLTDRIDEKHIVVTRKGGKKETVFLGSAIRGTLRLYLRKRKKAASDSTAMFMSRSGRITQRSVQMRLKLWAERAGITKDVTPHVLRHTFATDLLDRTGNLHLAQKALGHASVETTTIYTHLEDDLLEDALEAL